MSGRRDFLALLAGVIAAGVALPACGQAEEAVHARAELERIALTCPATARMLEWWDEATGHERLCFVLLCKRLKEDVPMAECAALFRLDLTDPSRPVSI